MRRPLFGLLLVSSLISTVAARPALADPPPAPLAPTAAPAAYSSVPLGGAAPLAGTRRRSSGAMIAGILLTSVGAVGMATGTAIYATAVGNCTEAPVGGTVIREDCENSGAKLSGMTVLLTGAAAAAAGVPLWIYGSEKVALSPAEEGLIRSASVVVGPTSATLRVTF